MDIDVNSITCPQCGGNDIKMESEISGICQSCGTRVHLSANEEDVKEILEKDDSALPKVYELPTVFEEDEFIKRVLLELEKDDSPADVYSSTFTATEKTKREVLAVFLNAEISYTVSVGYDRKEQYIDYERKWNDRTRRYEDVEVVKERTVTDWSPFSGTFVGEQLVFVNNGGNSVNTEIFARDFNRSKPSDISRLPNESAAVLKINENAQQEAFDSALDFISDQAGRHLPGDRYRDMSYRLEEVLSYDEYIYLVPEYRLNFEFDGNTYRRAIYPFAQQVTLMGDHVHGKSDEISMTCWNQVKNRVKLLFIALAACFVFALIPIRLFVILGVLASSVIGVQYLMYAHKIHKQAKEDYASLKHDLLLKKLKEMGIKVGEEMK